MEIILAFLVATVVTHISVPIFRLLKFVLIPVLNLLKFILIPLLKLVFCILCFVFAILLGGFSKDERMYGGPGADDGSCL